MEWKFSEVEPNGGGNYGDEDAWSVSTVDANKNSSHNNKMMENTKSTTTVTDDNGNDGDMDGWTTMTKKKPTKKCKLSTTNEGDTNDKTSCVKPPRVKREKAVEVANKIKTELVNNYSIGVKEMDLAILALSVGYKHPRSDAILAAKKILIQEQGIVESCKVGDMPGLRLNPKGVDAFVPKEPSLESNEAALDKFWSDVEKKLSMDSKTKNAKAINSAKAMYDLLSDGLYHSKDFLLAETHYGMVRSTGFPETLKCFQTLGITEKKPNDAKCIRFTDKVFPFGRPSPP
jgi:hypothetical protein